MGTVAQMIADKLKEQFYEVPGVTNVMAFPCTGYTVFVDVEDGNCEAMNAVRTLEKKILFSNRTIHLSVAMEATDDTPD